MSKNQAVVDIKPNNMAATDPKPKMQNSTFSLETEQLHDITLQAGQPMGLLLALTYPTTITVQTNISP